MHIIFKEMGYIVIILNLLKRGKDMTPSPKLSSY